MSCSKSSRRPAIHTFLVSLAIVGTALFAHWHVLFLGFFSDDHVFLEQLGGYLSGRWSFIGYLVRPYNEHILIVPRLLFWGTHELALDNQALALRSVLVALHTLSALLAAWLAYFFSGSRLTALVTGVLFAGAVGFSGTASWFATNFTPLNTFFLLALVGLCKAEQYPRYGALLAVSAFCLAMLTWQIGVLISVSMIAFVIFLSGASAMDKLRIGAWVALVGVGFFVLLSSMHGSMGSRHELIPLNFLFAGWAVLSAPFRFVSSWFAVGNWWPGIPLIAAASGLLWGVILLCLSRLRRTLAVAIAVFSLGGLAICAAAGFARSSSGFAGFYFTGRYYYFLLLPFSMLTASAAVAALSLLSSDSRRRILQVALVALLGMAVWASKLNVDRRFNADSLNPQLVAVSKVRKLAREFAESQIGRRPETALADGWIYIYGLHLGRIRLSSALALFEPRHEWKLKAVVTPGIEQAQNNLLDSWAQSVDLWPTPACVRDGRLNAPRLKGAVDFTRESDRGAVVQGFHAWERSGGFRWMEERGVLLLKRGQGDLVVDSFLLDLPFRDELRIFVSLNGRPLGSIDYKESLQPTARFPVPDGIRGSRVTVVLESSRTWLPSRHIKGNPDSRRLSIGIRKVGFTRVPELPGRCTASDAGTEDRSSS